MILRSPAEIAFEALGIPIYFYGITMALGVAACLFCANFLYKKFYGDDGRIVDFAPYLIIAGLLGARLYYCALNFSYYAAHPLEILAIRQGGLSIHGMIIVGIIALWVCAKIYKISAAKLLDVFACGAILGQAIGRWGNFFNQEAFGTPTDGWLKLFIPVEKRPFEYMDSEFFHPAFLYESVLNLIIFGVLTALLPRLSKKPGMTACLYLILYCAARILVESLRVDSVLDIGGVAFAQIISVVIILAAAVFMIKLVYVHRNN